MVFKICMIIIAVIIVAFITLLLGFFGYVTACRWVCFDWSLTPGFLC